MTSAPATPPKTKRMNESLFLSRSLFFSPSKNTLQLGKPGNNSREQLVAHDITAKLFPRLSVFACPPTPQYKAETVPVKASPGQPWRLCWRITPPPPPPPPPHLLHVAQDNIWLPMSWFRNDSPSASTGRCTNSTPA